MGIGRLIWIILGLTLAVGAGLVFVSGLPLPAELALSIQGGQQMSCRLVPLDATAAPGELQREAARVMERRFAALGCPRAEARPVGEGELLILAPGLDPSWAKAAEALFVQGQLGFRLVVENEQLPEPERRAEIKRLLIERRRGALSTAEGAYEIAVRAESSPKGRRFADLNLEKASWSTLLLERGDLGSGDVASASVMTGSNGLPGIAFVMTDAGAERLRALTASSIGRTMAIVVDGETLQLAKLRSALGGEGIIQGSFTPLELRGVAGVLGGGALRSTPELISATPVPARALARWLPWIEDGLPWALAVSSLLCLALAALSRKREPAGQSLVS